MITLEDVLQQEAQRNPDFLKELRLAEAELRLGMLTALVRQARGMTQQDAADRAGMTQPVVARYERAGRTPSTVALWKLADALDCEFTLGPGFSVRVAPSYLSFAGFESEAGPGSSMSRTRPAITDAGAEASYLPPLEPLTPSKRRSIARTIGPDVNGGVVRVRASARVESSAVA